jgi:hypothetical protein
MKTKILITVIAVAIVIGHRIWPNIEIDSTTIILIVIAILPWLAPIVKSMELPGGFKIELQDIKTATTKVVGVSAAELSPLSVTATDKVGVTDTDSVTAISKIEQAINKLRSVAENDPNLALVGVGIEIEKRLLDLAEKHRIIARGKTAGQLLWSLRDVGILSSSVASGLQDLIALRNQAAHGAAVSSDAAAWVLNVSPSILSVLDELASDNEK